MDHIFDVFVAIKGRQAIRLSSLCYKGLRNGFYCSFRITVHLHGPTKTKILPALQFLIQTH